MLITYLRDAFGNDDITAFFHGASQQDSLFIIVKNAVTAGVVLVEQVNFKLFQSRRT